MSDNANPAPNGEGATAPEVTNRPSGPLSYDEAASHFEGALTREEQQAQTTRDEQGRFTRRGGEEPPESDEPEVEAEAEAEGDTEVTEDAEDTGEQAQFESVEELAEALEMSPDDFLGKVKVTVKVDGKTETLPLSEVRDGYQRQADYTRAKQAIAEQRKQFEAEREQFRNESNQRITEIGGLVKGLEQQFVQEYQSVNWQELRMTDPAEFAARRQEFAEKVQWIEQVKGQAVQEVQKQQEAMTAQQQAEMQKVLARESERLVDLIPEWKDSTKAKAEKAQVREYLQSIGYGDEEINNLYDARAVSMVRKAMLFDQGKQQTAATTKKVKTLPKLQKPGARQNPKEQNRRATNAKLDALRKSGKTDDAAAVFFDRL